MLGDRVLVVSAHPDDEILGCGGVLAKLRKRGAAVRVLFVGEGSSCRFDGVDHGCTDCVEAIKERQKAARAALGHGLAGTHGRTGENCPLVARNLASSDARRADCRDLALDGRLEPHHLHRAFAVTRPCRAAARSGRFKRCEILSIERNIDRSGAVFHRHAPLEARDRDDVFALR